VAQRAGIIELVLMRGQFLGQIADYERAEILADALVGDAPSDGNAFVARAAVRATFHRFADALADLETAEQLGVHGGRVDSLRASIYQATGRYDEALTIRQHAAQRRADIRSLVAFASLQSERGDIEAAEQLFSAALQHYRDVSPFPVAWLYFQHGLMWMREGKLERARELFTAAHERLPQYAAAAGHLAEVEAALGQRDRAIELLQPLAHHSDDPDYAAQLARILAEVGQLEAAQRWRAVAAARYDDLIARHPEAFMDHAAEFWLTTGSDPRKALALAERNLALRPTPRAYELVLQAALAAGDTSAACSAAAHTRTLSHLWPNLRSLTRRAEVGCGFTTTTHESDSTAG
jgi:tetratricopeptide (TPR) repeat protein